jgi:hypothetical protein
MANLGLIAIGMLVSTVLGRFVIPAYYVPGERLIAWEDAGGRRHASLFLKGRA